MPGERERSDVLKAPNPEKFMAMMGRHWERICKIPVIGVPLARAWNRNMARFLFYTPGTGVDRQDSLEGVKEYLLETGRQMNFPFEIIEGSETPDSFEFYVHGCPYGFKRPDQAAACDAAMEMDRVLFRCVGGDLIIQESAVEGAESCRILMKWRG